jgi:hypothetical protein
MFHTIWPPDPKGETQYLPHELGHGAIKKQMLDRLGHTTEQHLVHPFHFLFATLSLVNTTPFLRYQRKILIFNGILAFQAPHSTGVPDLKTKSSYKSLTENFLQAVQTKVSLRLLRFTSRTLPTSLHQLSQLTPTNTLLKETFSGLVLSTWATDTLFFLTKLYRAGYLTLKGSFPNQRSS